MRSHLPKVSEMTPTGDPSIFEHGGRRYHVPGSFPQKLVYFLLGCLTLLVGLWFCWDPLGRLLFGERAEARVVRIVKVTPGAGDEIIRYRCKFSDEHDRSVTFQHYVQVMLGGSERTLRLGVDSRVKPYANVNDTLDIVFYKKDIFAFVPWSGRTWGFGVLYAIIGLVFFGFGLPMLLAVGKPIEIDPEAHDKPGGEDPPTR